MLREVNCLTRPHGEDVSEQNKNPALWLHIPLSLLHLMPPCHCPCQTVACLNSSLPARLLPFLPFLPFLLCLYQICSELGWMPVAGRHTDMQDKILALEELAKVWIRQECPGQFLGILSLYGHLLWDASLDPLSWVWCLLWALQIIWGSQMLLYCNWLLWHLQPPPASGPWRVGSRWPTHVFLVPRRGPGIEWVSHVLQREPQTFGTASVFIPDSMLSLGSGNLTLVAMVWISSD